MIRLLRKIPGEFHRRETHPVSFGVLVVLAAAAAACAGAPPFVLPTGAGVPAPDAAAAWTDATASCRSATTFSSELRLSGRAGAGRAIKATVLAGVTDAGQIRLEAPAAFGRPLVTLAGVEERATLVTRDNRVLTAPARDILEAITGISLGPRALLAVLSGCGASGNAGATGVRHGDLIVLDVGGRAVYLRAIDGRWRVVAAELPGLLIDYGYAAGGAWPARVRVVSTGDQGALTLTMAQQQVEANGAFRDADFVIAPPPGAVPMTLAELRAIGNR
jgi:hypothetical protein